MIDIQTLTHIAIILGTAILGALVGAAVLMCVLRRLLFDDQANLAASLKRNCNNPLRLLLLSLGLFAALPFLAAAGMPSFWEGAGRHALSIVIIIAVAWLLVRASRVLNDVLLDRFRTDVKDNLRARKVHTQLRLFSRIIAIAIVIIALGAALMTFERVRQLGTSILASAGIAGIIIGFAAQKSLATLIAGIQIAITQPIRIDDVVIVEGEWGRIEEITLTYVVVRIWDLRRLILPITYFIDKPFQNWTRVSADLLGTVFIHVDYTAPVEAIRQELHRILQASELWDGKVSVLQVTNAGDKAVELRALMSVPDAGTGWELRCHVREQMIRFLQENYPACLPRVRADITSSAAPSELREDTDTNASPTE